MPVTAEFTKDNRVVVFTYSDPMDMNDFIAVVEKHRPMFAEAHNPTHIIIDATRLAQLPDNIYSMVERIDQTQADLRRPNIGTVVLAATDASLRVITGMTALKAPPGKMQVVDTLASAWEVINRKLAVEE